jgi:sorting nexin-29
MYPLNLKVNEGLRHVDAVFPLLLNVVLEIAIRRFKVETRGTIFDKRSQITAYADNVIIMGRRLQDVKVFTSLVRQTDKMGLEINGEKTKFIIVSQKLYHET